MLPGLITAILALGLGMALRKWGGRKYQRHAVPAAAAVLMIGIDLAYDLPFYVYIVALFVAPLLFHRSVKGKLSAAAAKIPELSVPRLGLSLRLTPDPSGQHIAFWRSEDSPGAAPLQPILLTLDFAGEAEDDYQVSVWGTSQKYFPVRLVVYHPNAEDVLAGFPKQLAPVAGIPGCKDWGVRCNELDFALSVLDQKAAAALIEVFSLRTDEREMYLEVDGGVIRVVSNRTFNEDELRTMLEAMVLWVHRVRGVFAVYRPPPAD
jgi:hypothetical protein